MVNGRYVEEKRFMETKAPLSGAFFSKEPLSSRLQPTVRPLCGDRRSSPTGHCIPPTTARMQKELKGLEGLKDGRGVKARQGGRRRQGERTVQERTAGAGVKGGRRADGRAGVKGGVRVKDRNKREW